MARTPSTMLELGTLAPDFHLPEPRSGRTLGLAEVRGTRGTVVLFICNHCPFVKLINAGLVAFGHDYLARGLGIVAISSNDAQSRPEDGPEAMAQVAVELGYPFPYLFDAEQGVAKAYRAACTPDLYLFDAQDRLVYRGQFDAARPGNEVVVTGADLRAACDALLAGTPIDLDQRASLGCNIKWRPGNEPDYYA